MKTKWRDAQDLEYFRGTDFSGGSAEAGSGIEPSGRVHKHTAGEHDETPDERMNRENEERINSWMNNIKAFIRNIDVRSL
ncbi:MAG: hypothetical protein HPY84_01295 [Syntrophobacteraceae bacterium]|nr:hypothetical protein [Syntrophobacteraceae bacterium]